MLALALCIVVESVPVRLVGTNGVNPSNGRLEVYYNGRWGTVCDDGFSMAEADVVCRQLGLSGARSFSSGSNSGNGTIWLDDVYCNGSESSIAACRHSYWGHHNCHHSEDVIIQCSAGKLINISTK